MFLALKKLDVRMPDLSVAEVKPGAEVPGFATWAPWTKKAMLDGHMVKWCESGKLAPDEQALAERVVVQPLPTGPLGKPQGEGGKAFEPTLYKPAEPDVYNANVVDGDGVEYAPAVEATLKPVAAPMLNGMDAKISVSSVPPSKGAHDCNVCGKQGFKDFNGLKVHMARVHKEA